MPPGTIALAVSPGVPIFEASIPCAVFGRRRTDFVDPWYRFALYAEDPQGTDLSDGFTLSGARPFDALTDLEPGDTIIVPACTDAPIEPSPALVDAVREAAGRGVTVAAICTGAFVLAEAGLLDGRRAAVHWLHADLLAERYPAITVDPSVLYIDEGTVLTSAGTAAGLDLCLHIVRRDLGAAVANRLARRLVIPPHRAGGQAQFVDTPVPLDDGDSLAPLLDWMVAHLGETLTVADLARRCYTSERTLIRRFRAVTGMPPQRWLLKQRVQSACSMLESTDVPLSHVAERCGFGSEINLRHHFGRLIGVPPGEYRRTFRLTR